MDGHSTGQDHAPPAERLSPRWSELAAARSALFAAHANGTVHLVTFTIELEREADGRWLAEVPTLPGVLCYGHDRDDAVAGVQALALRVIAERLEHREAPAELLNVSFIAA